MPKLNPNITPQTINPSAIKPPIFNIAPKKEKSFLVVKTTVVKPPNHTKVRMAALGRTSGEANLVAIYNKGVKIKASPNT